jgi:hypothetical protein
LHRFYQKPKKKIRILGSCFYLSAFSFAEMANPENTKLCDFTSTNNSDVAKKKPLGRINDVLIVVNNNLVPVDFLVMDVECQASCPIILGRPFLRTVGAIIDMREVTIKYPFPLKKGMEHFPRKRKKLLFDSILRANYELDASSLDVT